MIYPWGRVIWFLGPFRNLDYTGSSMNHSKYFYGLDSNQLNSTQLYSILLYSTLFYSTLPILYSILLHIVSMNMQLRHCQMVCCHLIDNRWFLRNSLLCHLESTSLLSTPPNWDVIAHLTPWKKLNFQKQKSTTWRRRRNYTIFSPKVLRSQRNCRKKLYRNGQCVS